MAGQAGLFDLDERYAALSRTGDPLERLAAVVDFEMFRADLDAALARSDRSKGGRPPMDAVMMFKVLVLQALYGLADEQTEFQIPLAGRRLPAIAERRDRLSFMRFPGLDLHGRAPDGRTIWLFRELLTRAEAVDALFARFDANLRDRGYLAMGGQMIDVEPLERHWSERQWRGIIAAPRQRNTDAEKADVKAGRIPEDWTANPAKLRQKDRDGRWTLKRGRRKPKSDGTLMMAIATPVYGYKSHVGVDRHHRFIRTWGGDRRRPIRRSRTRRAAGPKQYRLIGLGRHRVSLGEERAAHRHGRARLESPLPQTARQADARAETARERRPFAGAIRRRACLRRPEAPHGAVRPLDRHHQSARQDRPRQHRLQHAPASVLGDGSFAGMAQRPRAARFQNAKHSPKETSPADHPDTAHTTETRMLENRSLHGAK